MDPTKKKENMVRSRWGLNKRFKGQPKSKYLKAKHACIKGLALFNQICGHSIHHYVKMLSLAFSLQVFVDKDI